MGPGGRSLSPQDYDGLLVRRPAYLKFDIHKAVGFVKDVSLRCIIDRVYAGTLDSGNLYCILPPGAVYNLKSARRDV